MSTTNPQEAAMRHVIVIGNGMVGARFAEDLIQRDRESRYRVSILGAEEHEPYNRVLLSDFVAGRTTAAALHLPMPADDRIAVHRGAEVLSVDRAARTVRVAHAGLTDPVAQHYDLLVFATGAQARVLPLPGVDADDLPPGLHVLRSLDHARGIVAATMNAQRAVVVGGGVLGLEAAAGLARRGVRTTVVHAAPAIMERQLNPAAAAVAAAGLAETGVHCEVAAQTVDLAMTDGRVAGLNLADGRTLPADLVVMCCGTEPETAVARAAGLACGRGIEVGADLRSPTDPAVFAIGDCASPPDGGTGLIAQGWEQARQLAEHLTGGAPGAEAAGAPTDVVRVKADGVDIVSMGRRTEGARVLQLSDPAAGRHVEVAVQDGELVGATCIGAGQVAGDLIATYTRGTPLPTDPAALLMRPVVRAAGAGGSPVSMPDRTQVCRCNGVTKRDLMTAWGDGARTRNEVAARTRATTGCGGCGDVVDGILDWLRTSDPEQAPAPAGPPARARELMQAKQTTHRSETPTT